MKRTINEMLEYMRRDPEIKELLIQGATTAPPNRKRKRMGHITDEKDRMFKKVWASYQGLLIRAKLELMMGTQVYAKDAAQLYYHEITGE